MNSLLVDAMCGRLVTYLRMCGYDAAYAPDRGVEADAAVADLADREGRLVVTRDRGLARRVEESLLLDTTTIEGQLRELRAAGVGLELDDPERCSRCNGRLDLTTAPTPSSVPAPDEAAVWRCRDCGQHYWKGSHWADVESRLHDSETKPD